ncbi:hypothetical protein Vafri_9894 [Volvox africanus]|nr:hypothetical protein Vafri_9894 [Volvox africanus]
MHSGGAVDGDGLAGRSHSGSGDRSGGKGSAGGANDGAKVQCESGDAEGSRGKGARVAIGGTVSKLPPPLGLLSPEELLSDPRVVSDGLVATRPKQQDVQGGDAWDSEEAQSSDSDA